MVLFNKSAQPINCIINTDLQFILYPHERKNVEINIVDTVTLQLSHMYGSCYGDCFGLEGMYQIVLNTTIIFTSVFSDSIISISREKVHFAFRYTYDRYFCSCNNGRIIQETHNIAEREGLCNVVSNIHTKDEAQDSLLGFILEGHFLQATALFILFKLCFWANNWTFPWWTLFIFWSIGYLLRLAGEKLFNIFQKSNGTQEYHTLKKYTSYDYIQQYYANPQRKWIANDIENE